jgi:hypothetical protein
MDAADRVISYLYGTRTLAIEYSPDGANCEFSSDAAFADTEDRKSSEGYLFKMFGGAVDWRASKQKTVTTSTTEADYSPYPTPLVKLTGGNVSLRMWD